MIQNALCFRPKPEKSDGNVQNLPSPKSESSRKSYPGRRQMQQPLENGGGGQQQLHENSEATAEGAPRRSTNLMDQILSASRRFTNSVNSPCSGESGNKHEVEADDGTAPVLTTGNTKLQAAQLITTLSAPVSAPVDTTDENQQFHGTRSASVPLSRESSFLLGKTDEKNSEQVVSPVPSDNMPALLEPVEEARRKPLQYLNLVVPEKFTARKTTRNPSDILLRQQASAPPRFLENSLSHMESDFSFQADPLPIPGPKAALLQNKSGLENHSSLPLLEQEKADEYRVMQMILPSVPNSDQPHTALQKKLGDTNQRSPLVIEDEEEEAEEKDSNDDKRDSIVRLVPISQPDPVRQRKTRLVDHGSGTSTTPKKNDDKNAHDDDGDGMLTKSTPNSPPAIVKHATTAVDTVNYNSDVSTAAEKSDHHRFNLSSSSNEDPDCRHDRVLYESFRTPSSVEDSETMALLWEEVNPIPDKPQATQRQPPVVEEKPPAAPVARAVSFMRSRKVRFYGFDTTSKESHDPSETLLGKLSATKHQQVQYLQDELEQTRAKVAELELDCEAQRDLKLAFKVQAVRLGAALKKLREFTQENGLDPRGAEGKRLAASSAISARPKGNQDNNSEQGSKEINCSPELNRLKALRVQAKQFGWLCDPKEVELGEQIGTGSTADIFKGIWHNLDVAVKCWRLDTFGGNMDAIAAFCKEVELVSRPRHPYILHMFAACLSPPDHPWIITEYLSMRSLTEWLHGTKSRERNRTAPLPPMSERLRIAIETSMAMQYLHKLAPKILHRDLKPSNILLDERNHVRISDFNCARCFNSESDAVLTGETGTYLYMAPEVMAHESYDEKCDIYSFAVILCELVTGNPPYIDTSYSPAQIACKVAQGTLRPTLPESQPPALVHLIKRAWVQQPAERPSFSKITATLKVIAKNI